MTEIESRSIREAILGWTDELPEKCAAVLRDPEGAPRVSAEVC